MGTQLTITVEQQTSHSDDDNPERAPAVGSEYRHTHLREIIQQGGQLVSWQLAHRLHLIIADEVWEERLWHQGKEQADASSECKRYPQGLLVFASRLLTVANELLQGKHSQQGNGEFRNNQYRGYRSEFGIHGYVVEEEVCERHEVTTPRKEY